MDSSALVKFFVHEEGREAVLDALGDAAIASSSRLAYVECRAAISRARREGRMDNRGESQAGRSLDRTWPQLQVIELDDALMSRAGDLSTEQPLRASDAIHLAAAELISEGASADVTFACWDRRLWDAASAAGFSLLPARPR